MIKTSIIFRAKTLICYTLLLAGTLLFAVKAHATNGKAGVTLRKGPNKILTGTLPVGIVSDPIVPTSGVNPSLAMTCPAPDATLDPNNSSPLITNIITFSLKEESTNVIPADFKAEITFDIISGPSSSNTQTTSGLKLDVGYTSAGRTYSANSYYHFKNAKYVKVVVTNLTYSPSGTANAADLLRLENEMEYTYYYELSNSAPQFLGFTSPQAGADEVLLNWQWPTNDGTSFARTEIEWTWLEDEVANQSPAPYQLDGNGVVMSTSTDVLFKNNASRVDLPPGTNNYNIPFLYDGAGKLYARIRAVMPQPDGSFATGPWSSSTVLTQDADNHALVGHNDFLNWQSATSFAEDGKRKTVIQYFDGSLRGRQTVTKDNTTNTVVTAETFYDKQGRPAIQILPTPGITGRDNIIAYRQDLNIFNGQAQKSDPADIFDLVPANSANLPTPGLDQSNGSSQYYSGNNGDYNVQPPNTQPTDGTKNIPDAQGYPYTQTVYAPDATGRIAAQGGVGPNMQIGSGHETKYYYGSPSQEELDGLFGTEVGNASHYFKNMVVDANGQASVSYVDMHGRTIATALAGSAPTGIGIKPINNNTDYPNQGGTTIHNSDLFANGRNIVKGNTVESVNTIIVSSTTHSDNQAYDPTFPAYTFNYKLDGAVLPMPRCADPQQNDNYQYKYDLEIQLVNDMTGEIVKLIYNGVQKDEINLPDINSQTEITFTANPPEIGSYTLRKTLTLTDKGLQDGLDQYLQVGTGLCTTLQDAIKTAVTTAENNSGCAVDGYAGNNVCLEVAKGEGDFTTYYYKKLGFTSVPADHSAAHTAYVDAVAHCASFDLTVSHRLQAIEDAMLADMTPFSGQYATNPDPTADPAHGAHVSPANGTVIAPSGAMFSDYNVFANGKYAQPSSILTNQTGYVDASGNIDPAADQAIAATQSSQNGDVTTFAHAFKNSWAQSLLPYHPEWKKLQFAKNIDNHITDAYDWVEGGAFAQATTYQQAQTAGFLTSTGNLLALDPFFAATAHSDYAGMMQVYINSNWDVAHGSQQSDEVSLWKIAYGNVACFNVGADNLKACYQGAPSFPSLTPGSSSTPSLQTGQEDAVWQNFKGLYQTARETLINTYINSQTGFSTDDNALVSAGFILRFPNAEQAVTQSGGSTTSPYSNGNPWYVPGTNPTPNTGGTNNTVNQVTQLNISTVASYASLWRNELLQNADIAALPTGEPGYPASNVQDALINKIIGDAAAGTGFSGICLNTINDAHPAGATDATDVNLPNHDGFYTFEQVFSNAITWFNTTYPNNTLTPGLRCNVYVIQTPAPYKSSPRLSDSYISTVDECACTQYQTIIAAAGNAVRNTSGQVDLTLLNGWLTDKYGPGQTISAELFEGLGHCSNLPQINLNGGTGTSAVYATGYTLASPQPLPYYLVCGFTGGPQALTCNGMATLISAFKAMFNLPAGYTGVPLVPATGHVLSPDDLAYNKVFENYVNYKTGFRYSWADYLSAMNENACSTDGCSSGLVAIEEDGDASDQPAGGYVAQQSVTLKPGFDYVYSSSNPLNVVIDPEIPPCGSLTAILYPNTWGHAANDPNAVFAPEPPCQSIADITTALTTQHYQVEVNQKTEDFSSRYLQGGLDPNRETFTMSYSTEEYHYTLYYYDMAGNLVKTVPPKGVNPDFTNSATIENDKQLGIASPMPHTLVTNYRYNSLNEVVAQNTPDAGTSQFWYDALGRLAVSQNAKQAVADANGDKRYSYTIYDPLGRISEVGEKPQATAMTQDIAQKSDPTAAQGLASWLANDGTATLVYNKTQITRTTYDQPYVPINGDIAQSDFEGYINQQNLRNRVSYTEVFDIEPDNQLVAYTGVDQDGNPLPTTYTPDARSFHTNATYYTYDIHGNVNVLLQDYGSSAGTGNIMNQNGNRFKKMEYDYDLISGKVNKVAYQACYSDAMYHQYNYDAENRLVNVETSRDDIYYEKDAAYSYYKHGPLMQTVLGWLNVQTLNYAYTIQGWLKSVNDGWDGSMAIPVSASTEAAPVYGFSLHYYQNDYKAIGDNTVNPQDAIFTGIGAIDGTGDDKLKPLYNGNIAAMAVNINVPGLTGNNVNTPMVYHYSYDQLNRLVAMDAFSSSNTFASLTKLQDYHEEATYDPNGNIITYLRNSNNNSGSYAMDDLTYHYAAGTNHLSDIADADGLTHGTIGDIGTQSTNNYTYDEIGNLVRNNTENIGNTTDGTTAGDGITWTVYGKIATITKRDPVTHAVTTTINYTYDVAGNRISKTVTQSDVTTTTWYVCDASGNVMSIYTAGNTNINSGRLSLAEIPEYGSSRLGEIKFGNTDATDVQTALLPAAAGTLADGSSYYLTTFTRGEKIFELSNHLGNVLVTISDKRLPVDANNDGTVDSYTADVITANDYYPGGSLEPGRQYPAGSSAGYRFGFNGKENDNDIETGAQDYGERIYDSRIVRFLSVDPLTEDYPFYTPYQFAGNTPIQAVDYEGLEPLPYSLRKHVVESHAVRHGAGGANPLSNFVRRGTKSGLLTILTFIGAVTQFIGREEYGSRIKNPDPYRDFPTIGDKSYKQIIAEMLVAPAQLAVQLKNDPTNPELWGQAIAMIALTGDATLKSYFKEKRVYTVLSKSERLQMFTKAIEKAPSVNSQAGAIDLINNTLDAVEDLYSGIEKAKGMPDRDDGRMYGILDDKYVKTQEDGTKIAYTKGNRIILNKDGSFEIQTKDGSKTLFKKAAAKVEKKQGD